jgi:phage/plasmid-associated DNA primase
MFELSNDAGRDLLETVKEIEAKKEDDKSISEKRDFVSNNWIKEGVENDTINQIKERGGAVWLSPDGDILFRPQQTAKIIKLEKAKAQNVLANYLDREAVRLFTGTKEVDPDIFPNELLCVTDKFTPFAHSEFLEIEGMTYRTPWRPTQYMSAKPSADEPQAIKMLLARLTAHNPIYYRWMINWMAGFLQTRRRSQCALVLKGDQGSGKGILFEHIITPLFGEEYCIVIDDDRLHSNFKNWISGNLFYNLNEISHDMRTRKAVKNFIKQLVTDTKVQAEQKYKDAGAIEIFGQVLITSNELAPLEIETSDRRFTIIQTDQALKKDGINTTKLIENIKSELMAFASYLIGYNVDWVLFDTALDTPEKRAVVNATTDKVILIGNAIKMKDISFFEPMEETNTHLYNLVCDDLGKGRLCQSHLKQIYEGVFDDTISAKHIINRLATFDVSLFGDTKKSNGKKYYILKYIQCEEFSP